MLRIPHNHRLTRGAGLKQQRCLMREEQMVDRGNKI